MGILSKFGKLIIVGMLMTSCKLKRLAEQRIETWNKYEKAAMNLAKENRLLKAKIAKLEAQVQSDKMELAYFQLKTSMEKNPSTSGPSRSVASIQQSPDDQVKFNVYKWGPEQLSKVAIDEFEQKKFLKSVQFYITLIDHYSSKPNIVDAEVYYKAAMAAFQSEKYLDGALKYFDKVIQEFPDSPFYRSSKLWKGIVQLKKGDKKAFFETVEEFRKKYRNTEEWKILSAHYENMVQKYK